MNTFPAERVPANKQSFMILWTDATANITRATVTDLRGTPLPNSTIVVGADGLYPLFLSPSQVLYTKSSTGSVVQIFPQALPGVMSLNPSGDITGAADTAAINAACQTSGHVRLAAGEWFVSNVGLTVSSLWLQGDGAATVLNVIAGQTGITVTGPGNLTLSDMEVVGGTYAIVVNGAYDAIFERLNFFNQTSGYVKINGDLATEQHWVDVVGRGGAGVGFDLERTTSAYTGSLYLDRVRLVQPNSAATGGFRFNSTAGSASLNIAFMTQCVADNYSGDAYYVNNCAQVFVEESWFAINGSATAGSAAMRITGGFMQSYTGCYTYSGLASPSVVVSGNATGVRLGGGHTFDGTPLTTALGLSSVARGGFRLGDYIFNGITTLTDTPFALAGQFPAGWNGRAGEEVLPRLNCNSNVTLTSGLLVLSYFTAQITEVISTIEAMTNTAASGATYVGYGLYTVSDAGLLTLVAKAEQTSGFTLWTSAYQPIGGFNTKLGIASPSTYTKQAGVRYAVGALFVGTTAPALIAALPSNGTPGSNLDVAGTPLGALSAQKSGQTTLGAIGTTIAAATLAGCGWMPYFVLD